jgi:hypothetical protein
MNENRTVRTQKIIIIESGSLYSIRNKVFVLLRIEKIIIRRKTSVSIQHTQKSPLSGSKRIHLWADFSWKT